MKLIWHSPEPPPKLPSEDPELRPNFKMKKLLKTMPSGDQDTTPKFVLRKPSSKDQDFNNRLRHKLLPEKKH